MSGIAPAAASAISAPSEIPTPRSILVVAPHPDDEVIGVGGTAARSLRLGGRVHFALGSWRTKSRLTEAKEAAKVLGGATVHAFGQVPVDLTPERELVRWLEELIDSVKPEVLLVPEDAIHGEHRAWHRASLAATRPSGGTLRWRPPRVWCWEAPADQWGPSVRQNVFVTLESIDLDRKLDAMRCHESQLRRPPSERAPETLDALARLRGAQSGTLFAEAFRSLRDVF